VQGHKSATCLDKDKCRLCRQPGHFARNCPNPWGTTPGTSGAESGVTVTDGAGASVPDPGAVDDGGVGSVETVVERGDSMEVGNLLGATLVTPSAEAGISVVWSQLRL